MNQQTKVSIVSGLVMIFVIILLVYSGYSKKTEKISEKNTFRFDQNNTDIKADPANQWAEVTTCFLKTNNKNEYRLFNIFGPPEKIVLPGKVTSHLRIYDPDPAIN